MRQSKRIGAVEAAGVDQARGQAPDVRPIQGIEEHRVLPVEDGHFDRSLKKRVKSGWPQQC